MHASVLLFIVTSAEILLNCRSMGAPGKEISDSLPRIFFGVADEGVKFYSLATNEVHTLKQTAEFNDGVTHDTIHHRLCWSSAGAIYGGGADDDEKELVFNSSRYGTIRGLAHDWITGNLYGVSYHGIVFVCNTTSNEKLDCEVLLSGEGNLYSVAVNPIEGVMYWTNGGVGETIRWAQMDGTNPAVLVDGLKNPHGITLDFDTSRLYWTEADKVSSSSLRGENINTIVTLPEIHLWGVATLEGRVFWGTDISFKLQSSTKTGEDVRTLYDGVNRNHQMVAATSNLPRNRTNHCQYYNCPRICVLTATYAHCVD